MKSGMVKRMLAAALAAIVTSAGTTDVWAAGSEETVSGEWRQRKTRRM